MVFGSAGRRSEAWIICVAAVMTVTGALAQPEQNGACELPLVVPDAATIEVELGRTERGPGLLLTWPEPADEVSTCTALVDTAGLGLDMRLTGLYGDRFDRRIKMFFQTEGTVGDTTRNRFVCFWENRNSVRTGTLAGEFNLSNTGGLWVRDSGGEWSRRNDGLPHYLPYTNLYDLAVADDGTRLAILSAGAQAQNDPVGVYVARAGGDWAEAGADVFGSQMRLSRVAIDPQDSQRFAVGTFTRGLYVTDDGGETFTQWTSNLDPSAPNIPLNFEVTALRWTDQRLYVAVRNYGLFLSTDGASYTRLASLVVPTQPGSEETLRPVVNTVHESVDDPDHLLVGLTTHGVWESLDAGQTWQSILVDYAGDRPRTGVTPF